MTRREFNTALLAGMAAAGLPAAASAEIGPPGDDPGPDGPAGLPGVERAYLTATGGRCYYTCGRATGKSTSLADFDKRFRIDGVVVSCVGYLPGRSELYCLGQQFIDAVARPDVVVKSFERMRKLWAPRECFVEADGLADKLLGTQPDVFLVHEDTASVRRYNQSIALDQVVPFHVTLPGVVELEKPTWSVVGPKEPHNGKTLRMVFPVRPILAAVEGEALTALRAGRTLGNIFRKVRSRGHEMMSEHERQIDELTRFTNGDLGEKFA